MADAASIGADERMKTVLALLREDLMVDQAAALHGVSSTEIESWRAAYLEGAKKGLEASAAQGEGELGEVELSRRELDALVASASEINGRIKWSPLATAVVITQLLAYGGVAVLATSFEALPKFVQDVGPVVVGAAFVIGFVLFFAGLREDNKNAKALLRGGEKRRARIIEMETTGVRINKKPEIRFTLLIYPKHDREAPRAVIHKQTVGPLHISKLDKGVVLDLRCNPEDLDEMLIDWG